MGVSPSDVVDAPEPDQDVDADAGDGDAPTPTAESDGTSWVRDALFSTEPDPPLEHVESPYDPERGGLSRIYRALMKATGVDGTPAIVDAVLGAIEWSETADLDVGEGDGQEDGDDDRPGDALEGGNDLA